MIRSVRVRLTRDVTRFDGKPFRAGMEFEVIGWDKHGLSLAGSSSEDAEVWMDHHIRGVPISEVEQVTE